MDLKKQPQRLPGWIHLNFICGPRLPWPPFHSQWFPWYMGEKKRVHPKPQALSQDPSKVWFKTFKTHVKYCKIEYGDLRRNYANLRRNLGMCFLAFVYFFWNVFLGFLVASIMDCWQPFCNSRLSPVWPNHFSWLELRITLDQNDGREEMNQNLWPMWCQTPTNAFQVEFQKCRWNNREMP